MTREIKYDKIARAKSNTISLSGCSRSRPILVSRFIPRHCIVIYPLHCFHVVYFIC